MWINQTTKEWSLEFPQRVRLPNGLTLTGSNITESLLSELGWQFQEVEEFAPSLEELNTGTNTVIGE